MIQSYVSINSKMQILKKLSLFPFKGSMTVYGIEISINFLYFLSDGFPDRPQWERWHTKAGCHRPALCSWWRSCSCTCTVFYCTVLYCILLYCIVMYCTVLYLFMYLKGNTQEEEDEVEHETRAVLFVLLGFFGFQSFKKPLVGFDIVINLLFLIFRLGLHDPSAMRLMNK